jgi:hypothetical protein
MPRLYGRKGFTQTKLVRELLDAYERPAEEPSTLVRIEQLPATVAKHLLAHLPKAQHDDRATDDAPTFAELVNMAAPIDAAVLGGYRVPPELMDERVSLDTISLPSGALDITAVAALAAALPDPSILAIGDDGSAYAIWK